jgi:hypothetical protein
MAEVMKTGAGKKLLDEHMGYLMKGDIDGMVRDQYTPDAMMYSPYDILDTPAPHVLTTHADIANFFKVWAEWHGEIGWDSDVEGFAETADSVMFSFKFHSKRGKWFEALAWHLKDGKIDRQYGFETKLD